MMVISNSSQTTVVHLCSELFAVAEDIGSFVLSADIAKFPSVFTSCVEVDRFWNKVNVGGGGDGCGSGCSVRTDHLHPNSESSSRITMILWICLLNRNYVQYEVVIRVGDFGCKNMLLKSAVFSSF